MAENDYNGVNFGKIYNDFDRYLLYKDICYIYIGITCAIFAIRGVQISDIFLTGLVYGFLYGICGFFLSAFTSYFWPFMFPVIMFSVDKYWWNGILYNYITSIIS